MTCIVDEDISLVEMVLYHIQCQVGLSQQLVYQSCHKSVFSIPGQNSGQTLFSYIAQNHLTMSRLQQIRHMSGRGLDLLR